VGQENLDTTFVLPEVEQEAQNSFPEVDEPKVWDEENYVIGRRK